MAIPGHRERIADALSASAIAIFVALAALLPLVVLPGGVADDTDVLPKVLVTRAVTLVLAMLWITRAAMIGRVGVRRAPLDLPLLAFVASAALSTLLSVNPTLSLGGAYTRYEGLITIATYAVLFWLGAQFLTRPQQARWLLRAMLAGAAVECVIACAQAISATASGELGVYAESSSTFGAVARAMGTMANPNNLAIWLAMLIPVALYEVAAARPRWGRALAAACVLLMAATLALTFGRSAWIGAALGVATTAVLLLRRLGSKRVLIGAAAGVLAAGAVVAGGGALAQRFGVPVIGPVAERLLSFGNPLGGSGGVRLHFYEDTLRIVAARPLLGYGPDTFGLVYPSRSSGDWTPGVVVDKSHSDILQVAATQGLLGAGAELWLLIGLGSMLYRGRHRPGVAGVAGGAVAYEAAILLNFAWFPVTAPFWILLVAATALTESGSAAEFPARIPPLLRLAGAAAGLAAAAFLVFIFSIRPALANAEYAQALDHWSVRARAPALQAIAAARSDDGAQSVYAALQGDVEADAAGDRPGPGADLRAARSAYESALAAGDMYPAVAIRLAYVDVALGDQAGAHAAARAASALDPYGPAVKLVTELGG